jgi:hypothetical protein
MLEVGKGVDVFVKGDVSLCSGHVETRRWRPLRYKTD